MLKIQENVLLKDYTTFQVGGRARFFVVIKDEDDLREACFFAKSRKLPILVLGGGSNLLIADQGFSGLIIKNDIKGIKFTDFGSDQVRLEVGAGETWDEVVALSVIRNLSGLENLSGIPGTVGGAAVQNAGAYGAEIKDILLTVEGLNAVTGKKFGWEKADCQYGYRSSAFKKNKKFIITAVTLKLSKKPILNLDYAGLKDQLPAGEKITPGVIRDIVLQIRAEKLPDWKKVGTAGSFFKNPVVSKEKFADLKKRFPELPGFPVEKEKIKIPLAWILDKICGLKGFQEKTVGLYEKQPLVLVNRGGATADAVIDFAKKIKDLVRTATDIEIEAEVEFIK